ncbi:MAG: DUF4132 domain-containing protein [Planctomycetota bacterium]
MRRELLCQEGGSDKFWTVEVEGSSHTVHFGRRGTSGQRKTKDFASPAAALAAAEKLIAQKLKGGYVDVAPSDDAPAAPASPESAALEPAWPESAALEPTAPEPAAKPAPRPAPVATAVALDDPTAFAELSPGRWHLAAWRGLPPLSRGKAKAWKRDQGLKKLRSVHKAYQTSWHTQRPIWDRVIPVAMTREEACFWWSALSRIEPERGAQPADVADMLAAAEPEDVDELAIEAAIVVSGQATPDRRQAWEPFHLQWPGAAGADGALRLLPHLLGDEQTLALLLHRLRASGCWDAARAGHRETSQLIEAFARHVLPYLDPAVHAAVRAEVAFGLDPAAWPAPGNATPGPWGWLFAGLLGCADACARLVDSWADGRFREHEDDGIFQLPTWALLGLGSDEEILRQAARLGLRPGSPLQLEAWLAATGPAGISIAVDAARAKPSYLIDDYARACCLLRTPDALPHLLRLRENRTAAKFVDRWQRDHPLLVARGLLRAGRAGGEQGELALDLLDTLRRASPEVVAEAEALEVPPGAPAAGASEAGAPEAAALEADGAPALELADLPPPLRAAAEAVAAQRKGKEDLGGISLRRLPPPRIAGASLGDEPLALLIRACQTAGVDPPTPGPGASFLAALRAAAEPASCEDFAWALFQAWLGGGAPSGQRWVMNALGHLGGDRTVAQLTPLIRAWPGESQHQRAVYGLAVLRQLGSDHALAAISGIAAKVKFRGLKERAGECMDAIAAARGLGREELADRLVPDCGLDAAGRRGFDYGSRRFELVLGPELVPMVRDERDKLLKAPPKPGKTDDPERAPAAYEEWKAFKKLAQDTLALQRARLEQAMVAGRRWSPAEFRALLVSHPLLQHLVRALLWAQFPAGGGAALPFRIDAEGVARDVEGGEVELAPDARVGVLHPLHLAPELRARWDALWDEVQALPPFPQLRREVFRLEGRALEATELRGEPGARITPRTLRGVLLAAGWLRGQPQDAGVVCEHLKHFPAADLTAVLQHEGISVSGGDFFEHADVERCVFLSGAQTPSQVAWLPSRTRGLPLREVDPVVLSEVIRDLQALARAGAD